MVQHTHKAEESPTAKLRVSGSAARLGSGGGADRRVPGSTSDRSNGGLRCQLARTREMQGSCKFATPLSDGASSHAHARCKAGGSGQNLVDADRRYPEPAHARFPKIQGLR